MMDNDSEDEIETMVIELGNYIIKAAFSGEKTCRYVSDNCNFTEDGTGMCLVSRNGSDNSIAIVDHQKGIINNEDALVSHLGRCWTEQYECLSTPDKSRLLLIMSQQHKDLTDKVTEIILRRLQVKYLAVLSHGEAVSTYSNRKTMISLDIGECESRIETFIDYNSVGLEYIFKGGKDVSKSLSERLQSDGYSLTQGDTERIKTSMLYDNSDTNYTTIEGHTIEIKHAYKECIDSLFQCDEDSHSIPAAISQILDTYHKVSVIVVSGATSFLLSQEKLERYLNLDRTVKFSLCPERNKMVWLGGSVIGGCHVFNHRFYLRDDFASKSQDYVQLVPESQANDTL